MPTCNETTEFLRMIGRRQKIAAAILAYDTSNVDAHRLEPLKPYVKIPAHLWSAARSLAELVKESK